jgi:prepilin peptidase CpaA
VVVAAAIVDLRHHRIPNALTLPALLAGWVSWGVLGSWRELLIVIALTAAMFAVGLLLFAAGVLGGGDGKLLAAVAAIAGPRLLGECLLWTLIFGVIVSVILLASRGALIPFLTRIARAISDLVIYRHTSEELVEGTGHHIAYGVVIAGGVLLAIAARHAGVKLLS